MITATEQNQLSMKFPQFANLVRAHPDWTPEQLRDAAFPLAAAGNMPRFLVDDFYSALRSAGGGGTGVITSQAVAPAVAPAPAPAQTSGSSYVDMLKQRTIGFGWGDSPIFSALIAAEKQGVSPDQLQSYVENATTIANRVSSLARTIPSQEAIAQINSQLQDLANTIREKTPTDEQIKAKKQAEAASTPIISRQDVEQKYQAILGRAPTEAETNEFMRFSTELGPSDIENILRARPEMQEQTLGRYAGLLDKSLATNDQRILAQGQNQALSLFAKLGRPSSSGLLNAFAESAQNLAAARQAQVSSFLGPQYGNLMGQIPQNAAMSLGVGYQGISDIRNRANQLQDMATQRGYQLADSARQRQQQLDDYNLQMSQYLDAINRQNAQNKKSAQSSALGSLAGMGLGLGASALIPGFGAANILTAGKMGAGLGGLFGGSGLF